jgi:hypothetical protein
MTALTFDTHAYVKRLRDAGFTEVQAEAQATALVEALKGSVADLATKADLKELELRIDARLEALKVDILKWVIGIFIAQIGIFAALGKLLH